jgi:hypothetical protein
MARGEVEGEVEGEVRWLKRGFCSLIALLPGGGCSTA